MYDNRVEELDTLTVLDLSENVISSIDESIGLCILLVVLKLSGNSISEIPDNIGLLTNLTTLECHTNPHLPGLPITTTSLCLHHLSLHSTSSTTFPFALPCWPLITLDLSNNPRITEIPETVASLSELKILDASGCAITSVPPEISGCVSLEKLDLRKNRIGSAGICEDVGDLECLLYLNLRFGYYLQ